ncbi:MAG: HlyD family type I secretion periplasmic adaptor subunit [Pseudomonadota bacterium]
MSPIRSGLQSNAEPNSTQERSAAALKRSIRRSLGVVAFLVVVLGGLASFVPISGAVIAVGTVSVESAVKRIGHPFGGTVNTVLVSEGERVAKGQPLMRLDETVEGANSELTGLSVDQLQALEARLIAERDDKPSIAFPDTLTERASDPAMAAVMANEERNFQVRKQAQIIQRTQLQQRAQQASADISAYRSQVSSFERQSTLIDEELQQTRELYEDRLTTLDRLNALQRTAADLEANRDTASANIVQSSARIAEARAQASSVSANARSAAAAELVQVQSQLADLRRRQVAADDALERSVMRSPADGLVSRITISTIGAVVPPGDTIFEIVPETDAMIVEARVMPEDVDQVLVGSDAILFLSGLNRQTTPELAGTVTFVSPNRLMDENNLPYFKVNVAIPKSEVEQLGDIQLRVGMPVETFIQTGERTLMSFVLRPLLDQLRRAFRSH